MSSFKIIEKKTFNLFDFFWDLKCHQKSRLETLVLTLLFLVNWVKNIVFGFTTFRRAKSQSQSFQIEFFDMGLMKEIFSRDFGFTVIWI